uniref:pentapeptide repeat-containing protein n=1 Tax=Paractinoplanes polyasparticus TaxID=2856853 RepID=UPI0034DB48A0
MWACLRPHGRACACGWALACTAALRRAALKWAVLKWAALRRAVLKWAALRRAVLKWAALRRAVLKRAALRRASLSGRTVLKRRRAATRAGCGNAGRLRPGEVASGRSRLRSRGPPAHI